MNKVVITQEMLEDAKTCGSRGCGNCKMYDAFKREASEPCVSCQEVLAAALDEERKLHGDIIARAPERTCHYHVLYHDEKDLFLRRDTYYLSPRSPEDIIIEKHGEHAREILDEYKALLDADK